MEAAARVAGRNNAPILLAATLNQVDRDGGYTGWLPDRFVAEMRSLGTRYGCEALLYPCLDHGGPWLKDRHTTERLSLGETMAEVKLSITACLEAGYQLLHVDSTVDRTLPAATSPPVPLVVARTVELITYAESERRRLGLAPVAYEVGTEEVHGGLADVEAFKAFLAGLRAGLSEQGLLEACPSFVVGKVGTDLHTAFFDPEVARRLVEIAAAYGCLVKGHYTDWVENPEMYPQVGMGGANVGPELTAAEAQALADLCIKEAAMVESRPGLAPSRFMEHLEAAVLDSGRWRKWLLAEEQGLGFHELAPARRAWLVQTGARYVWTAPGVVQARQRLYDNLAVVMPDPGDYVVDRIGWAIERYVNAFRLFDAARRLAPSSAKGLP
jgi:tagatose-1,6-bisphosphate aldolase non-catalytic subunit AgaZ/GatZ